MSRLVSDDKLTIRSTKSVRSQMLNEKSWNQGAGVFYLPSITSVVGVQLLSREKLLRALLNLALQRKWAA